MANTTYYRRKEQGLCVACGKELDRAGLKCTECLGKSNKADRNTYHWFQENGICPVCRKYRLMNNEKSCLECRARKTNNNAIRMNRNEQELRKKIAIRDSNKYNERKRLGLCVACGKDNDSEFAVCNQCRIKRNSKRRVRGNNQIALSKRRERILLGLCYQCGEPVKKGYKLCETHYQRMVDIAHSKKNKEAREQLIKQGVLY